MCDQRKRVCEHMAAPFVSVESIVCEHDTPRSARNAPFASEERQNASFAIIARYSLATAQIAPRSRNSFARRARTCRLLPSLAICRANCASLAARIAQFARSSRQNLSFALIAPHDRLIASYSWAPLDRPARLIHSRVASPRLSSRP